MQEISFQTERLKTTHHT